MSDNVQQAMEEDFWQEPQPGQVDIGIGFWVKPKADEPVIVDQEKE